jgi:hypothetical protein
LVVLPPAPDREFDREDADDPVDQAAGDKAGARQPLEATAPYDLLPADLGLADRTTSLDWRLCGHAVSLSRG